MTFVLLPPLLFEICNPSSYIMHTTVKNDKIKKIFFTYSRFITLLKRLDIDIIHLNKTWVQVVKIFIRSNQGSLDR